MLNLMRIITLMLKYGDGCAMVFELEWYKRMMALDALERASEKPHGLSFQFTGSGANAFVTQIGDQANDMSGKVRQNWMLRVNGQLVTVGCGEYELKPFDTVEWVYMTYDPDADLT